MFRPPLPQQQRKRNSLVSVGRKSLGHTLAFRLRDIARVLDRLDRLESGSGSWLKDQSSDELESAALGMTLRVLQRASDPTNFTVLSFLLEKESSLVANVQEFCKIDRMTLSERLNDLVQVGLVIREIDTDHVQISDAGKALVMLFNDIQRETATRLREILAPVTTLD